MAPALAAPSGQAAPLSAAAGSTPDPAAGSPDPAAPPSAAAGSTPDPAAGSPDPAAPPSAAAGTTPSPAPTSPDPAALPGQLAPPVLSVVRGQPTAAEIAALVAVLAVRARARTAPTDAAAPARASRSGWSDRSRLLREPVAARPGGWRASARPR